MAIVKKQTIEDAKKKPTATKAHLEELSQKRYLTPAVLCDNNDCRNNSRYRESHKGVAASCLATHLTLTKTWAGHVDNYRLVCLAASDYKAPVPEKPFNLGREHELPKAELKHKKV